MKNKALIFFLWLLCNSNIWAQFVSSDTLIARVWNQSVQYPQEKLYLHTDRSIYSTGEIIWLRAFVVNASSNKPEMTSRYAYVELVNPFNEVVKRIRLRQDSLGYIYGHLALPDTLPSGEYFLRSYTRYMENTGVEYFFRKNIQVVSPLSKNICITSIQSGSNRLELKFVHPVTGNSVKVYTVHVFTENGELPYQYYKDKVSVSISWQKLRNKVLLVQAGNFKEFLPLREKTDYSVSFMPEGGYLLNGVLGKIAFKSLNERGLGENITGRIMDERDSLVTSFASAHLGMGRLSFIPLAGRSYRAVCRNSSGLEKVFDLPTVQTDGYALKIERHKGNMICYVQASSDIIDRKDSLYLLVHQRGIPRYAGLCTEADRTLMFEASGFSNGIVHFLLLNKELRIISERKVFVDNLRRGSDICLLSAEKQEYSEREKVVLTMDFKESGRLLPDGSCSIAVTDNRDVKTDSLSDILSTLLLTSDLKGYIESPAWYFQVKGDERREEALDMLMLTQGWTRYDLQKTVKGKVQKPQIPPEESMSLGGKVFTRLFNKPVKRTKVGISSPNVQMLEYLVTNDYGYFCLRGFEFPDTTKYLISAFSKSGGDKVVLHLDKEKFPEQTDAIPFFKDLTEKTSSNIQSNMEYLSKVDMKILNEKGIRHIFMDEVVVTASKLPRYKTPTESIARKVCREEDFKKKGTLNMGAAIGQMMISGLWYEEGYFTFRGSEVSVFLDGVYADGVLAPYILQNLPASDIGQVDFVACDVGNPASRGGSASIYITLKTGEGSGADYSPTNVGVSCLLGYQRPLEFYSPQYDTPEKKDDNKPDLRTTIYWKPDVTIKEGKAQVEFYTADGPVDYSIVVEGVTGDGTIIHHIQSLQ